jgi:hypothetical protein
MKTLISATILLISLTDALAQAPVPVDASTAAPAASPVQPSAGLSVDNARQLLESTIIARNQVEQTGDAETEALQTVLVVPGPDLKPETLAGVTEDMMVMCRIFDKALHPGARPMRTSGYAMRGDLPLLGHLVAQQTDRTQGLYLDGYGAVFFVHVDFPLAAPAQQKQEAQAQEPADRVWSQTVGEMRGQQESQEVGEAGPAYDAQKVENLKANLIRTLRHAANLRIRPQDQITVVVGTESQPSTGAVYHRLEYLYRGSSARRPVVASSNAARPDHPAPDPAATLVLRAGKSDLDALAAGKMTAEQFAAKVATVWSRAQPQAAQSPSTQPPAPSPSPR